MRGKGRTVTYALFGVYCVVMLWLLFLQRIGDDVQGITYLAKLRQNSNFIPFYTVLELASLLRESRGLARFAVINLAGNVVMFVPLGVFLPCIWARLRSWKRLLLLSFLLILGIELIQLFTLLGSFDIDDLLLNLSGVMLGYAGLKLLAKLVRKKEDTI